MNWKRGWGRALTAEWAAFADRPGRWTPALRDGLAAYAKAAGMAYALDQAATVDPRMVLPMILDALRADLGVRRDPADWHTEKLRRELMDIAGEPLEDPIADRDQAFREAYDYLDALWDDHYYDPWDWDDDHYPNDTPEEEKERWLSGGWPR